MDDPPFAPGTACTYIHPDDLICSIWGSNQCKVIGPHPMLPAMVEVIGESGDREYVRWVDLEPAPDKPMTYESFEIDHKTGLRVAADRSHAVLDRRGGGTIRIERGAMVELLRVINDNFLLDALGGL